MPEMQPEPQDSRDVLESNKKVVRQVIEAFNSGDPGLVYEIIDPDIRDHTPIRGVRSGPEGVGEQVTTLRKAFPDAHFEEETMIAEGDMVFLRWRMTGRHEAQAFSGERPSGDEITRFGHEVLRVRDGRIVEHLSYFDARSAAAFGKEQDLGRVESGNVA